MAGTKQPAVKQDRQEGGRVTLMPPPKKKPTKPAPQATLADRPTNGREDS